MYKKILKNMRLLITLMLLLTTVIVLSSNYTFFKIRLKNEVKSCATIAAGLLNANGSDVSALSGINALGDFCITLYDSDEKLVFDNRTSADSISFSDSRAVMSAKENGVGETSDDFSLFGENTYSYAIRLEDGSVLQISSTSNLMTKIFSPLIIPLVFMFVLFYILCNIIAWFLTENIIKPIKEIRLTDIDSFDYQKIYPELKPLISKIKAQNNEIKRQLVKLKTRKTRFQTVSANINEGLLTLDTELNILSMNGSAERIFSSSEERVIHTPLADITNDNSLISALQSAKSGNNGFIIATIGEKSFNAFYSPVFENGNVCGILLLLLDITEKLESENIRKEFTANVSHELKTPLTTILGYSQIINNGIAKPEDVIGFSQKIEKEASRLIVLIDDIIKLSHLDEQKAVSEPQAVHFCGIVNDVLDRLRINADKKNITLETSGCDFTIMGNLMQLFELVYNLCDNAIKYTPDGGVVSVVTGDRFIKVTDNGIGIPKEYHERIFERFFRVDKSRSHSVNGTGLGLSIVKHIAKQHNAQITIESALGKGTSITVRFD